MSNEIIRIFNFNELFDADEMESFIKKTEKQFRMSYEYSIWLNNFTDRDVCAVTNKSRSVDRIKVEVHHYSTTLYGWCEMILNRCIDEGLLVNSHYFCLILSDMHLQRCIPYLPLCKTYHDQLHEIGEVQFMQMYPQANDFIYYGDYRKAYNIIDQHINILKEISNK